MSSFKKSLAIISLFGLVIGLFAFLPAPASAVDIAGGDLIKGASSKAVYYYGADGKRYCFPNENTYKTWYPDFSSVKTISGAELAAIPLRGNVTYKPGVKMIKLATDPKVYAIAASGTLRWVATDTIAQTLYSADWSAKVDDLADAFFVNYKVGLPIVLTTEFNKTEVESAAKNIGVDKGITTDATDGTTTLNAPVLTAPSTVATTTSFTLNWSTVTNALTYLLEKSAEAAFITPATFYSGANTGITDAITTTYYYRVKALKNAIVSAWSNVAKVEIGCPILTAPVLTISAAAANSGANYSLNWTNLGATRYTLQRATDASFTNASNVGLTSLTAIAAMENQNVSNDTTYYYRVKAANSCSESGWSNAVSVQVKLCPVLAAPALTISANLANTGTNYSLNWTDLGAASYTLQKAADASFTSTTDIALTALNAVTATENQAVNSDTTYYYRVKAANSCGDSAWSNAVNIKVVYVCPVPAAPILTDPGTTTANIPAALQWSAVADATEYIWDFYTDSSFRAPISASAGGATSVTLNIATFGTYYYRVRAANSCGSSAWSNVVDLVVNPAIVTLNVPAQYATIQAAINAAKFGDTVLVAAGTYNENLTMKDGVILKSAAGPTNTIINGIANAGGDVKTVIFNNVSSATTIEGFTIKAISNSGQSYCIQVSYDASPLIKNNLLIANTWQAYAIVVSGNANTKPTIVNNTIIATDNNAATCAVCSMGGDPTVINNIMVGDNASESIAIDVGNNAYPTVHKYNYMYNFKYGIDLYNAKPLGTGEVLTTAPPGFVNSATGDYHLQSSSPGVDAGDPTYGYSNEPAPNGSRINLGAYGNTSEAATTPAVQTRSVPAQYATIQAALDAANAGDTVQIAAGTYTNAPLQPKNGVIIKGAGLDSTILKGSNNKVIKIDQKSDITISDLTIRDGSINSDSGAGIDILYSSNITIANCKITNNYAVNAGGINIDYSNNIKIKNCLIVSNSVSNIGGGVSVESTPNLTIENSTIADNYGSWQNIGGLAISNTSGAIVKNSIIWNNGNNLDLWNSPTTAITYSDIGETVAGTGNINQNPLFIGGGNYHLQQTSPAIDAGDPASAYSNEPAPNGSRINMGAYGNTSSAEVKGVTYGCDWDWPQRITNAATNQILWYCTWSKPYCYQGYTKCCSDAAHTNCVSMN